MTAETTIGAAPEAREIELSIEGMTCAACAVRVEKKLGKLDGVHAAVNYATATALVAGVFGPWTAATVSHGQAGVPNKRFRRFKEQAQ